MPRPLALALACIVATFVETVLFNTLTVARVRVQASRAAQPRPSPLHALSVQLVCLLIRRPLTLALQALLSSQGMSHFAAGALAGLIEGGGFTPTRRIATAQMAMARPVAARRLVQAIVADEGWGGLWRGWRVNIARTALGAGVYFAAVAQATKLLPGAGHLIYGAIGSGLATIALNPFEVVLARLYSGAAPPRRAADMIRGLALSLARNVPGGSLRWWLTQNLAAWLA